MTSAVEKWKLDLASWAIPQEILDQAEIAPGFIHLHYFKYLKRFGTRRAINERAKPCLKAAVF